MDAADKGALTAYENGMARMRNTTRGTRNNTLVSVGKIFWSLCMGDRLPESAIDSLAAAASANGLPDAEIRRTLDSAKRYAEPWRSDSSYLPQRRRATARRSAVRDRPPNPHARTAEQPRRMSSSPANPHRSWSPRPTAGKALATAAQMAAAKEGHRYHGLQFSQNRSIVFCTSGFEMRILVADTGVMYGTLVEVADDVQSNGQLAAPKRIRRLGQATDERLLMRAADQALAEWGAAGDDQQPTVDNRSASPVQQDTSPSVASEETDVFWAEVEDAVGACCSEIETGDEFGLRLEALLAEADRRDISRTDFYQTVEQMITTASMNLAATMPEQPQDRISL